MPEDTEQAFFYCPRFVEGRKEEPRWNSRRGTGIRKSRAENGIKPAQKEDVKLELKKPKDITADKFLSQIEKFLGQEL